METLEYIEFASKLEADQKWAALDEFATRWTVAQPNNLLAWQALGLAYRKLGRLSEAVEAFKHGIAVAPPVPLDWFGRTLHAGPLWFALAHAYAELKDYTSAKNAFREAAEWDADVIDIWTDLGVVCMESNDAAGAFEAFKKAVSLDGTNVNSIRNLGILYAMCKVEAGVCQMHEYLVPLDAAAAKAFIKKATELLKR